VAQFELSGVSLEVPDRLLTKCIRDRLEAGKYEANEARAAQLMIDYGDRVLELGAGVGYVSSICAMLAGAGNVMSVEANPRLLNTARTNLDRNDCEETVLLHGAVVGAKVKGDRVHLKDAHAFWASSLGAAEEEDTISVPALVLSDLLEVHKPTVVIMDVEGAEADLFDTPWPDFVRVITVELHPNRYPDTVIKRIFDGMSASGLIYAPHLSRGALVGFCRQGAQLDASGI
jgi:FkbM family methyltransferase